MYWTTPSGTRYQTGIPRATRSRQSVELIASAGVYRELLERYAQRTDGAFEAAQTSDEVAEVVLKVLAEPEPKFRYQTSPMTEQFVGAKLKDLDGSAIQALTSTWVAP